MVPCNTAWPGGRLAVFGKLLTWLYRRLFGLRYHYFELRDGKYLRVKRGAAKIIDLEDVPEKHRTDHGEVSDLYLAALESVRLTRNLAPKTRRSVLEDLPPFAVLEKAQQNSLIERDILENPELVDADSTFEAQLKLDLVDGKDISSRLEDAEEVTETDVEQMLDTEFLAKWGYNRYGEDLPAKLTEKLRTDTSKPPSSSTAATNDRPARKGGNSTSASSDRQRVPRSSDTSTGSGTSTDRGRKHRVPRASSTSASGDRDTTSGNDVSKRSRTTSKSKPKGSSGRSGNAAAGGNSASGGNDA